MKMMIYGFEGAFTGEASYEYRAPEPGAWHRGILFLAQSEGEGEYQLALAECALYGFSSVRFSGHGVLQVETLNSEPFREFAPFYEEALSDGSALFYYPHGTEPHDLA